MGNTIRSSENNKKHAIRQKLKKLKNVNTPIKLNKQTHPLLIFAINIKSLDLIKDLVNSGAIIPSQKSNDYSVIINITEIVNNKVFNIPNIGTELYCNEILAQKKYNDNCYEILRFLITKGLEVEISILEKFLRVNKELSRLHFKNILYEQLVIMRMISIEGIPQKIFQYLVGRDITHLFNKYYLK